MSVPIKVMVLRIWVKVNSRQMRMRNTAGVSVHGMLHRGRARWSCRSCRAGIVVRDKPDNREHSDEQADDKPCLRAQMAPAPTCHSGTVLLAYGAGRL